MTHKEYFADQFARLVTHGTTYHEAWALVKVRADLNAADTSDLAAMCVRAAVKLEATIRS